MVWWRRFFLLVVLFFDGAAPFPIAQEYNDKSPYFFAPLPKNPNRFACESESNKIAPRCNTKKNYRTGSLFDDGLKQSDEAKTKAYLEQYRKEKAKGVSVESMELTIAPPHFPLLDERDTLDAHDIGCKVLTGRLFFDVNKLRNVTVLDVGCGFGTFVRCLIKTFGPNRIQKYVGVSMNQPELTLAKQIMADWGVLREDQYDFRIMDMNELDKNFKPNTFDYVFNRESFVYANSPEMYLKHVYSILKPGGALRMIAGFLRRSKLTFAEGELLEQLYGNDKIMGKDNPYCVLSVSEMRLYLIEAGYKFDMLEDLAPYIKPTLERVLKMYYEAKADADDPHKLNVMEKGFAVNFAQSQMGGLLSMFFVSGTKASDLTPVRHNNLLRGV